MYLAKDLIASSDLGTGTKFESLDTERNCGIFKEVKFGTIIPEMILTPGLKSLSLKTIVDKDSTKQSSNEVSLDKLDNLCVSINDKYLKLTLKSPSRVPLRSDSSIFCCIIWFLASSERNKYLERSRMAINLLI